MPYLTLIMTVHNKKFLRVFIILFIAAVIGIFILHKFRPDVLRKGVSYAMNLVTHCDDYDQKDFRSKLNEKLADYISVSEKSGTSVCRDEPELLSKVKAGQLLDVTEGEGYIIDRLHYSYPYLTDKTLLLLEDVAKGFRTKISATKLKDTRLIVTSMTRTKETIEALAKKNPNVSRRSPHLNGNAFDITYVRFKSNRLFLTRCDRDYLRKALSEVIWQLRKEQRCWATYEKGQHCFHVVAR